MATANGTPRRRTTAKKTPESPYGPRRRPGRPTKLTYELGDEVFNLIRQGVSPEVAAQANGIHRARFSDWSTKAADWDDANEEELDALDDEMALFVWFRAGYKKAEAEAEAMLVVKVQRGTVSNRSANGLSTTTQYWQGAMTILERRFPARWRRREEIDHSVKVETPAVQPGTPEYAQEMAAFGMPAAYEVAAGPNAVEPPPNA